jgi:hypothetical protein
MEKTMSASPDPKVDAGDNTGASSTPSNTQGISAVEIKMTVRTDQEMYAVRALDLDFDDAEVRELYFFDTPELALFEQGLILRARLIQDDDDDSTVKIRPVDPAVIPDKWRTVEGFKLEADLVGSNVVRSASLTTIQKPGEIRDAFEGHRPIAKLFSPDQEEFLAAHAPINPDFATLRVLGPVSVLRWELELPDLPYELTVEEWRLPNKTDLLELSIKVMPAEEQAAMDRFSSFLRGLELSTEGDQQAKTRRALEFFAGRPPA